ncbi:MAG: HTTM domain-containing protein [Bacteroidetes bacterium]|nr:MAG: HTTM domain-containing protein [Bacteroidota bacterium]
MTGIEAIHKALHKAIHAQVPVAPLAVFRALFGLIMLVSIIRFAAMGWIEELYLQPTFFFPYEGFEWVRPPGAAGMYALFVLMGVSALLLMLGWHYRLAAVSFFLSFTYVELIDKSYYLNHYYFISLVALLLIFLPAHTAFSLDAWRRPALRRQRVPAWCINAIKLQLGMVYVFAGIAKLNPHWLVEAMPLKLWLPAHSHLPLIGAVLEWEITAYAFSWAGALYDLFVVFFLLHVRSRPWAYGAVLLFHFTTALLFQIGMFPYIMCLATLIFFSPVFHQRIIDATGRLLSLPASLLKKPQAGHATGLRLPAWAGRVQHYGLAAFFVLFFALQLLLPFRYLLYEGPLFWTEQGYRFSWRVMLMEKAGFANFQVYDSRTGRSEQVANYTYLTPVQEKMMSTQPDMMLQFAQYLKQVYEQKGFSQPQIRVESYVSLNGRRSRPYVRPNVNLLDIRPGQERMNWLMPYDDVTTKLTAHE